MLNIELHGFEKNEAMILGIKLREIFQDKPYRDDYVITTFPTEVVDHYGCEQSFVRLVSAECDTWTYLMLGELHQLDVNVEVVTLDKYIPKKSNPRILTKCESKDTGNCARKRTFASSRFIMCWP